MKLLSWLKQSFKKSFVAIRKRKWLFVAMILIQLLFVGLFSYVGIFYQIEIFEDLNKISAPLEELANVDPDDSDTLGMMVGQYGVVYGAYKSLLGNLFWFGLWSALLFLTLGSSLWIIANYMLSKGWKKGTSWKTRFSVVGKSWLKYLVSTIVIFVPFAILGYFLAAFIIQLAETALPLIGNILLIISILLVYLILVCYTQISKLSWKQFLFSVLKVAFRKIYYSVLAFILSAIFLILPILLFYYATMVWVNFYLMLLGLVLILLALVWNKIFLTAAWNEVQKL